MFSTGVLLQLLVRLQIPELYWVLPNDHSPTAPHQPQRDTLCPSPPTSPPLPRSNTQGCVLYRNWWPMLTGIMYVLVPMPYLFFGGGGNDAYGYGSLASGCGS